ncbi:hypothetical protein [Georgenia wangjunii]|uniref:hypothetical protein n=1 Tax=Georgenia wangjunii TaxID=3117730 RepID=UPI002F2638E5
MLRAAARSCDRGSLAAEASPTWSEEVETSWEALSKKHLAPLVDTAVGALAIFAVGVVVSLLLTWPVGWLTTWVTTGGRRGSGPGGPGRKAVAVSEGDRLVRMALGVAVLAMGTLAPIVLPQHEHVLGAIALTLAVGAVLTAWAMSQSLRLSVRVTDNSGKDDHNASGHVAALIRELTLGDLKGLETPAPAGDTGLAMAGLSTTPEGRVAKAVYKVLELLVPRTPWVVRIQVESDDVHAVSVSQHGRVVRADVVERDLLGLRVPLADSSGKTTAVGKDATPVLPDMHRMCAAVVVAAFAERYAMPTLAGASNWIGIGLHFVAKTDLVHNKPERGEILGRALAEDPDNRPVLLEYWHHRFRQSTDQHDLLLYASFLGDFVALEEPSPTESLILRARYSRFAALVNRAYVRCPDGPQGAERANIVAAIYALDAAVRSATYAPGVDESWLRTMRARLAPALNLLVAYECRTAKEAAKAKADASVPGTPAVIRTAAAARADAAQAALSKAKETLIAAKLLADSAQAMEPRLWPPVVAYDWACSFASDGRWNEAVKHLRAAVGEEWLDKWRIEDPQLKHLKEHSSYRRAFGREPVGDFLELTVIEPHATMLKRIGATSASATLRTPHLDTLLNTTPAEAARIRQTARLTLDVPGRLGAWRLEIADLLTSRGEFEVVPGERPDLVTELFTSMGASLKAPPKEADLAAWLGAPPSNEA